MNATAVCRDVRSVAGKENVCAVIASQEEREGARVIDPLDPSNFSEVRNRLQAQGIVLGEPSPLARRLDTQSHLRSPIQIIAQDEQGRKHTVIVESFEEYSLSSGSTLYYLYVSGVPSDFHWLVGHALELADAA